MHVLFYIMAQDMMLMMDICLHTSHWMTAVRQREATPTSIQLSHLSIKFENKNRKGMDSDGDKMLLLLKYFCWIITIGLLLVSSLIAQIKYFIQ